MNSWHPVTATITANRCDAYPALQGINDTQTILTQHAGEQHMAELHPAAGCSSVAAWHHQLHKPKQRFNAGVTALLQKHTSRRPRGNNQPNTVHMLERQYFAIQVELRMPQHAASSVQRCDICRSPRNKSINSKQPNSDTSTSYILHPTEKIT
jgi:hypothetical protein